MPTTTSLWILWQVTLVCQVLLTVELATVCVEGDDVEIIDNDQGNRTNPRLSACGKTMA